LFFQLLINSKNFLEKHLLRGGMAFAGFRFAVELPESSKVEVIEVIEREKGSITKSIHSKVRNFV